MNVKLGVETRYASQLRQLVVRKVRKYTRLKVKYLLKVKTLIEHRTLTQRNQLSIEKSISFDDIQIQKSIFLYKISDTAPRGPKKVLVSF